MQQAKPGELTVYGDSISGNCLKVKFVADHLAKPYLWIETSVMDGSTRTPAFLTLNPAGQVPLALLPDGRPLAQSNAIMVWLAEGSALIPGDGYDRARMFEWLFWEQSGHELAIAVRRFQKFYLGKSDEEIDPALLTKGYAALDVMNARLEANGGWFVGMGLTLADVALVAYTRVAHEGGFDLSGYPAVVAWIESVEAALSINGR